ncbi:MAG: glycosyltransferase family 4 protein [Bacteroidota bacterium]
MNILILTHQGDIAGSTNSISYLAKGLARRGHRVFVGLREESLLFELLEDTGVIRVPMTFNGRFDTDNMYQIRQLVKSEEIQIINAQSTFDRYTSVFAKWFYRLPVKVIHTRRQISKSVGGFAQNLVYVKGTDKVIAVSDGVKESLISCGIPEKHIVVIHNGTPKEKYENMNPKMVEIFRNRYKINGNDKVIGCVSRLKEQVQIIEALKYLPFKVKMIFAGIEKKPEWDDIIAQYPIKHDLFFTGVLTGEETLHLYKIFNIKVLASIIEGLSQSLLEAMYMKVPVIATNAAGNPDLITNGEDGLLFKDRDSKELAKKIEQLFQDSALREKLRNNGFETVSERFSIDNTLDRIENLFSSLLK